MAFKMKAGPEGPMVKNFGSALEHSNKSNKHPGGDPKHSKHDEDTLLNTIVKGYKNTIKGTKDILMHYGTKYVEGKQNRAKGEAESKIPS